MTHPPRRWILGAMLLACPCARAQTTQPSRVEFPYAGISVALPDGFAVVPSSDALEIFSARKLGPSGRPIVTATLAAVSLQEPLGVDQFADAVMDPDGMGVQELEIVESASIQAAGRPAQRRLCRYQFQGRPVVAERVMFLRPVGGSAPGPLGYVLTVEARGGSDAGEQVPQLAAQIVQSLRLSEIVSPQSQPMELAEQPTRFETLGISLRLPRTWKRRVEHGRLRAFQADYTAGALPYPLLRVGSLAAPDDATAEQCLQRVLSAANHVWAEQGLEIVDQGRGRLLGQASYWAVLRMNAPTGPMVTAVEVAVVDGRQHQFSLTLSNQPGSRAREMLEQIGSTARLIRPQSQQ